MSREQTFARFVIRLVVPVSLINQAALAAAVAILWEDRSAHPLIPVEPQTNDNPGPIFSCRSAGAEVVVSLGGDGKSVFVWCSDVKP